MPLIKIISTGGTIANTGHGLIGIDNRSATVLRRILNRAQLAEYAATVPTAL